ncbi:hypothetical protein DL93DRAFT_2087792, partial [Clavulina sp. PMI_390]
MSCPVAPQSPTSTLLFSIAIASDSRSERSRHSLVLSSLDQVDFVGTEGFCCRYNSSRPISILNTVVARINRLSFLAPTHCPIQYRRRLGYTT